MNKHLCVGHSGCKHNPFAYLKFSDSEIGYCKVADSSVVKDYDYDSGEWRIQRVVWNGLHREYLNDCEYRKPYDTDD